MKKNTYIQAVIGLMMLLMLSRAVTFISKGGFDRQTLLFTIVEAGFLLWGVLVMRKDAD